MNSTYLVVGLFILIASFAIFGLWHMGKSAWELHTELDLLLIEANQAETIKELQFVWEKLKEISKKCWHKSFNEKLIEIKAIIETKHKYLKEDE